MPGRLRTRFSTRFSMRFSTRCRCAWLVGSCELCTGPHFSVRCHVPIGYNVLLVPNAPGLCWTLPPVTHLGWRPSASCKSPLSLAASPAATGVPALPRFCVSVMWQVASPVVCFTPARPAACAHAPMLGRSFSHSLHNLPLLASPLPSPQARRHLPAGPAAHGPPAADGAAYGWPGDGRARWRPRGGHRRVSPKGREDSCRRLAALGEKLSQVQEWRCKLSRFLLPQLAACRHRRLLPVLIEMC